MMLVYQVTKNVTDGSVAGCDVIVATFGNRKSAEYVRESLSKRDKTSSYFVESRAVHSCASVEAFLDRIVQDILEENPC